jgi:hypothetical protein
MTCGQIGELQGLVVTIMQLLNSTSVLQRTWQKWKEVPIETRQLLEVRWLLSVTSKKSTDEMLGPMKNPGQARRDLRLGNQKSVPTAIRLGKERVKRIVKNKRWKQRFCCWKLTGHAEGEDARDEEHQLDAPLLYVQHLRPPPAARIERGANLSLPTVQSRAPSASTGGERGRKE